MIWDLLLDKNLGGLSKIQKEIYIKIIVKIIQIGLKYTVLVTIIRALKNNLWVLKILKIKGILKYKNKRQQKKIKEHQSLKP